MQAHAAGRVPVSDVARTAVQPVARDGQMNMSSCGCPVVH